MLLGVLLQLLARVLLGHEERLCELERALEQLVGREWLSAHSRADETPPPV